MLCDQAVIQTISKQNKTIDKRCRISQATETAAEHFMFEVTLAGECNSFYARFDKLKK